MAASELSIGIPFLSEAKVLPLLRQCQARQKNTADVEIEATRITTLVVFLPFCNGLVFLYLGILGEYLGQIFVEVKRPRFSSSSARSFSKTRE